MAEKNTEKDDLKSMSIEDIMKETGVNRETATVIYESVHGINLCEPVSVEEFLAELESMRN